MRDRYRGAFCGGEPFFGLSGPDGVARGVPADLHAVMANLAQVWHWPPAGMWDMTLPELLHWHALAVERNAN